MTVQTADLDAGPEALDRHTKVALTIKTGRDEECDIEIDEGQDIDVILDARFN